MANEWDYEKFFAGFKPSNVGPFDLVEVEREPEKNRWKFVFQPVGAPDDIRSIVYGRWDEQTGLLTFWQIVETMLPTELFSTVAEALNAAANIPGYGIMTKTCVLGPEEGAKALMMLCGWSFGLYDADSRSEEAMNFLRQAMLGCILRIMMEVTTAVVEIHTAYPQRVET